MAEPETIRNSEKYWKESRGRFWWKLKASLDFWKINILGQESSPLIFEQKKKHAVLFYHPINSQTVARVKFWEVTHLMILTSKKRCTHSEWTEQYLHLINHPLDTGMHSHRCCSPLAGVPVAVHTCVSLNDRKRMLPPRLLISLKLYCLLLNICISPFSIFIWWGGHNGDTLLQSRWTENTVLK